MTTTDQTNWCRAAMTSQQDGPVRTYGSASGTSSITTGPPGRGAAETVNDFPSCREIRV
jgi:hypothetical protein